MNMFGKRLAGACAVVFAALMATTAVGQAQDIKSRTLKFSFGMAKDHPLGQGAQRFADLVGEKSGGKMKVQLFPNAILGGDNQNLSGARGGTVEMTLMVSGALVPLVKEFMIFDMPFLFGNAKEAQALADGPVGKQLMDKLPEHGLVGLAIWESGFRNVTNNTRPVTKVEDIKGLKLRVLQVPIYIDLFSTLGANPVPLAFPELYSALETGAVDGQENPVGLIKTTKFDEVQKYLSLTKHTYSAMPVLMSKKAWDGMSADERKIIQDAAREATVEQRRLSEASEAGVLDELKKTMQVNELSEAEVVRLRQAAQPVVDKYAAQVGAPLMTQVSDELKKQRGQ